ncbi:MATE family efflux transporter [Treponema sp.]|uniref:MATE family efflux transporter n=1 Tax=Treponema sp. TaxID=166 RepID=UPI003F0EA0E2
MDRQFYREALKMLFPVIIQNIFGAMMSSVDVVMLNSLGQDAISAGSLASQYTMIVFMFYYGISSGSILLAAQYFGKKDYNALNIIEGIALKCSLAVAALFSVGAGLFPQVLMRVYTPEPVIIEEGSKYLRIIWVYYLLWALSNTYFTILRSAGKVTVATVFNGIGFVLNIVLNAFFIFGLFGCRKLGISGVALATCISQAVCVAGCFVVSRFSPNVKLKLSYMFLKSGVLAKDFFKMSLPALLNDVSWGAAFSAYVAIMGRLGSDVVAANSVVCVVRNFATVFCYAVATVGGVMVGNLIGAEKFREAEKGASAFLKITVVTGMIGGLVVLGAIPLTLRYASLSEQAMYYLKQMLFINVYYIMGTAVNTLLIAGIFRAGGCTKFGLICDTIDMWGYGVIAGILTAFVFKLPVVWVYFFLCLDEFVKWPWVFSFYRSKKWLRNITRNTY